MTVLISRPLARHWRDEDLAATRQRSLAFAKDTSDWTTAERAAKACNILPAADKAELEAALTFVRTAVKIDKNVFTLLSRHS